MKTRSGLTSEATSVATRRSARLLAGQLADLDELRPPDRPRARARRRRGAGARSVRSIPVVTSETGAPSGPAIGLFDHAMSRRSPALVCQWPTCGLGTPVLHT
jgi:hypothetical protein